MRRSWKDLVPKQPLYRGEPILLAKLADKDPCGSCRSNQEGLSRSHVKVTRESAVAGLIFRVIGGCDVVRAGNSRNGGPRARQF